LPVFTMAELKKQHVSAVVKVGLGVDWQLDAFGSVWVASGALSEVDRISAATNRVVARINISNPCAGMASVAGSVWIPDCNNNVIDRVDPATDKVVAKVATAVADSEGYIAASDNAVWAVVDSQHLGRINPATNKVAALVRVPDGSVAVAFGFGALWVTSSADNSVTKVDATTNRVVTHFAVGMQPRFLATGAGAVWVLNQGDGTVSRIDPTTGKVTSIDADSSGRGGCISAGLAAAWVTIPGAPVTRIDAASNKVTEQFKGDGGDCISVGYGSVWLSNNDAGNVYRIRNFH